MTSDLRLGFEGGQASARTLLKQGDTRYIALSWGGAPPPLTYEEAYKKQVWTAHHWQHWLARGKFPDHPWRVFLQRSALTLKGLTYAPTGAIAAAGTTSLPETPGGERNYDYRYTWIRDATFALWGLYSLGFDWEALDFFAFIADVAERDDQIQIMYGIGGERELEEFELDHLPGYANSRPVRIGNAAYSQQQHDVWGALLDSVYLHAKAADHLDSRVWPILEKQVTQALKHWREPDAGIWEVRGELKHFTSSKIMCWVAADRGAKLARVAGEDGKASEWELAAQEIKEDILANGVDKRGVFTQYYGSEALDASLLLAPLVRFLPADDERIKATVLAIHEELTDPRPGAALQGGGDRRRLQRRGGQLHHLLVLAGVGAVRDRRVPQGPQTVRQAALVRRSAGAVRGGDRPAHRRTARQLPAGLHPPGLDQRRHARDQVGGPPARARRILGGLGRHSKPDLNSPTRHVFGASGRRVGRGALVR